MFAVLVGAADVDVVHPFDFARQPVVSFAAQGGGEIPALVYGTSHSHDSSLFVEALSAGYRHLDTAYKYGNGKSIGEALRRSGLSREEVFLTTKVAYWPQVGWPFRALLAGLGNDMELDVKGAERKALKKHLLDLGLAQADLCLLHSPFAGGLSEFLAAYLPQRLGRFQPFDSWLFSSHLSGAARWFFESAAAVFGRGGRAGAEVRHSAWRALEEARAAGECRYTGVSNFDVALLRELEGVGEAPAVNQIEMHPRFRARETVEYCQANGIAVLAFGAGVSRGEVAARLNRSEGSQSRQPSAGQLTLHWALSKGVGVIAQSSRREGMAENLALNLEASDEITANLLDAMDEDDRPFYYETKAVATGSMRVASVASEL